MQANQRLQNRQASRQYMDYDLLATNAPLRDALRFNAPALDTGALEKLARSLGSAQMQEHARLANLHRELADAYNARRSMIANNASTAPYAAQTAAPCGPPAA